MQMAYSQAPQEEPLLLCRKKFAKTAPHTKFPPAGPVALVHQSNLGTLLPTTERLCPLYRAALCHLLCLYRRRHLLRWLSDAAIGLFYQNGLCSSRGEDNED